jgi:ribosomal protein S18 acetylase RimI-like enzyme
LAPRAGPGGGCAAETGAENRLWRDITGGNTPYAGGDDSKLAMMRQTVTFSELEPAGFRSAIKRFVAVYTAAMNPPERMLAGREAILDRHAANPGFRALTAVVSQGDEPPQDGGPPAAGVLAGFTYGFHGVPGQWWHDVVASALAAGTGWLDDSLEVAELHVRPAYQGMGIGRELLLRLTSGRPERTAVLSTADAESRARRLYRGVGFTDLLTGFRFSGGEPPYAVMGAKLPLLAAPRSPSPSSW